MGGEVVNADSMQLYRGMDIGTAKVSVAERRGVPHQLLDVWDVTVEASVAEYQRLARAAVADVRARGAVPVLVGGSGLYDIEGLEDKTWKTVETPWGAPSDDLLFGRLGGVACVFLPRHGRGHKVSPSHLNYRANIDALKRSGVTDVISLSAVGSLREDRPPGHFVIVDQFIDRSFAREKSFFGEGIVAHVSMAHPVCTRLGDRLEASARALALPVSRGGTYLVMEGPQFSTRAESELYRAWGCDVIGMTNMPEAKLAREAELCYATVAMVTDFDCWHPDHDHVTVEAVVKVLLQNADKARMLVKDLLPGLASRPPACPCGCDRALDNAVITGEQSRAPALAAKLDAVAGRVLRGG